MDLVWLYGLLAFISGFMKGGFGFGAGMFVNPILVLFMSPAATTSILSPILWYSNLDGLWKHLRKVQWRVVLSLLPFGIIGTVAGSYVLVTVPDKLIKHSVAWIAISLTILAIMQPQVERILIGRSEHRLKQGDRKWTRSIRIATQSSIAVISGLIGSTANSGGLPLSFLFIFRKMGKAEYTANLVALLAMMDTFKIISYISLEILNVRNFVSVVWFVPLIYLGGFLGQWVHRHLQEKAFFALIHSMVIVISLILLI